MNPMNAPVPQMGPTTAIWRSDALTSSTAAMIAGDFAPTAEHSESADFAIVPSGAGFSLGFTSK
jgi:hypothetical protein